MPNRSKKSRKATSRVVLVSRDIGNDNKGFKLSKKHGNVVNKGLHNVGNTCYMNASLQCLARIPYFNELLYHYPIESATIRRTDKDSSVSLKISLPATKSAVTAEYIELIMNMRSEVHSSHASNTLNPSRLRESVLQRYPRFGGFGQQDSHELLRALLDCLKQEELVRWKRGILDKMGIQGMVTLEDVSDADRQLVRLWGRAASLATMVDRLFGGVLISTLQCCGCGNFRTGFEPFLDLSLPMPESEVSCKDKAPASTGQGKSKQELKRERKKKFHKPRRDHRRRIRQEQAEPEDSPDECEQRIVNHRCEGVENDSEPVHIIEESAGLPVALGRQLQHGDGVVDDSTEDSFLICEQVPDSKSPSRVTRSLEHPLDTLPSGTVVVVTCPADANSSSESFAKFTSSDVRAADGLPRDTTPVCHGCCADIEDSDETGDYPPPSTTAEPTDTVELSSENLSTPKVTAVDKQFSHLKLCGDEDTGVGQSFGRDEVDQAVRLSQVTVAPFDRQAGKDGEVLSLYACLARFTAPERLTGQNRLVCDTCTRRKLKEMNPARSEQLSGGDDSETSSERTMDCKIPVCQDSIRRDLILQPPPILTIHLKRFQQRLHNLQKSQKQVSFPVTLDLGPFCSVLSLIAPGCLSYRLHGVVEHLGRLADGHYVAYVPITRKGGLAAPDQEALLTARRLVTHLTNRSLDEPPKWPWTVDDLVRRLRRCDQARLTDLLPNGVSECPEEREFLASRDLPAAAAGNDVGGQAFQDDRTWCRCSDSHVEPVPLSTVLRCQAFMLFYARISSG